MISPARTVSVVIPTHNRRGSVERALRALSVQSYPLTAVEVVVVADGCTDETIDLAKHKWPFMLRIVEQPGQGPAAARNRGAAVSVGDLLVFLDDDIEPCEEFIAAHVRQHADGHPRRVAIGYLPPQLQGRRDFFAIMLRVWWESMFERMRQPGHRFAYNDLLSGNFSMARPLLATVGGFDESLRCHEDYELGLRLIAAGARLQFAPEAAGWHHEHTTLARALARKRDEGRADVALARKYPDLSSALPFSAPHRHLTRRGRLLKTLARVSPVIGDGLEACFRFQLRLLEAARLRGRWRRLLDDLLSYWYWRGVTESLGGGSLDSVCRPPEPLDPQVREIDLQVGLQAAMQQLDAAPARAVRLRWGPVVVGAVPAQPGAELLAGRHLQGLLRVRFARRLAQAIELSELLASGAAPPVHRVPLRTGAEKRPA